MKPHCITVVHPNSISGQINLTQWLSEAAAFTHTCLMDETVPICLLPDEIEVCLNALNILTDYTYRAVRYPSTGRG